MMSNEEAYYRLKNNLFEVKQLSDGRIKAICSYCEKYDIIELWGEVSAGLPLCVDCSKD